MRAQPALIGETICHGAWSQVLRQLVKPPLQGDQAAALGHVLVDGLVFQGQIELDLLRHVPNSVGSNHRASIGGYLTHDQTEKGRLSCAVHAYKPDFFSSPEREANVAE